MFTISNLASGYGQSQILHDLNLNVAKREIVAVMGRNGVGKTSLLRAISGLQPIASGSISLDGQDVSKLAPYDRARRGVQIEMVECARAHVEHLQGDGPAIVFCPTGIAEFLQGLQEAIYGWLGQLDFTGKLFKSDGALPGEFFQDTKNPHCRTDKRGSGGF